MRREVLTARHHPEAYGKGTAIQKGGGRSEFQGTEESKGGLEFLYSVPQQCSRNLFVREL